MRPCRRGGVAAVHHADAEGQRRKERKKTSRLYRDGHWHGGAVITLATGQPAPGGIAVDTNNVYWSNVGNGTIMKLAKSTTP